MFVSLGLSESAYSTNTVATSATSATSFNIATCIKFDINEDWTYAKIICPEGYQSLLCAIKVCNKDEIIETKQIVIKSGYPEIVKLNIESLENMKEIAKAISSPENFIIVKK